MEEVKRSSERNEVIQGMFQSEDGLKKLYRFVAQNPHIELNAACQIIYARPDAQICYSFEEWNALDRRVTKGRKGIPYADKNGNRRFVFDVNDTRGDTRYRRMILPMKRLLEGLDALNGTETAKSDYGDYHRILSGVRTYLAKDGNSFDEDRKTFYEEGIAYMLYSKTGFPKSAGITLEGYPYDLKENGELLKSIKLLAEFLEGEIEDAYLQKISEVPVINDTEEETVTDEPVLPENDEPKESIKPLNPLYEEYLKLQEENPDSYILIRIGDFYEVFDERAEEAAEVLQLVLTGRDVGLEKRVSMCGFPQHVEETYIEKLLEHRSVVVKEPNEEPKYILSHEEAKKRETEQKKPVRPELIELSPEESAELDKVFGMGAGDETEEVEEYAEEDEEIDEYEEYEDDHDEDETEDYDYEEQKAETESKPVRRIKDRKRRQQSKQFSLFDVLEPKGKTAEQEATEWALKQGGSRKYPIVDKYAENPTVKDFANVIKNEYGTGGSMSSDYSVSYDAKGFRFRKGERSSEDKVEVSLKWNEVAEQIADLIDAGEYLNAEEKIEYARILRFREERKNAKSDEALIKVIADQTIEYGTRETTNGRFCEYPHYLEDYIAFYKSHLQEISRELRRRHEVVKVSSADNLWGDGLEIYFNKKECPVWWAREKRLRKENEKLKDWFDVFAQSCADNYVYGQTDGNTVEFSITPKETGEVEYLFIKDRRDDFLDYVKPQKYVQDASFSMEKITIIFAREYIENIKSGKEKSPMHRNRVRHIVRGMVEDGIDNTTEGNWIFRLDNFGLDKDFILENKSEIAEEICLQKEVSDLEMTDDAFDINFWLDYCPNYVDYEEDPEREYEDRVKAETANVVFNRFKELSADNKAFFDKYSLCHDETPAYSLWGEVQNCTVIANGIYSVSTAGHGGIMVQAVLAERILSPEALKAGQIDGGYYCYEEDCDKCVAIRELYDKGILSQDNQYFARSVVRTGDGNGDYKPFTSLTDGEKKRFFKEWDKTLNESLEYWNKEYWQAHESITPTERVNTDLNEVGTDSSELGGAKQRFKNNVQAIKLVNRLYDEDRDATTEERKALAKYVGFGGLAQAFDERNEQWRREYDELKTLLDSEEYTMAKGSVLNAHYTSKEVIEGIYKALSRFGVKGNNRILEPAMGTGNFFGYMPKEISSGAKLYGVELDTLTGKIATKLYPEVRVQIKGFEDTSFKNDSFDLIVSNVPFGGYKVFDSDYNRYNFYIHDYFLAKGIDKIRPEGIMAVITSKGTMDKINPSVRKYIADRAELIGAIRLPNTAFKKTANTEVVTDILFFRKRAEQINATTDNTEWLSLGKTAEGFEINNYYISHPEMILGTLAKETGLYGAEDVTVNADGREISDALNEAISRLPSDFYANPERAEDEENTSVIETDYNVKPLNFVVKNKKLYRRIGDEMKEETVPSYPKDAFERISAMIDLRDNLRFVLNIQSEGCDDDILRREQQKLNARYDSFVRRYGLLNSQTNIKLFREDGDSALLFACEKLSEDKKTAEKEDVFFKRTIRPFTAITQTEDCYEALQISKNERGAADISFIEDITGKDYDTVLSELGDAVFRNPLSVNPEDKYSGFETAEEYLSGNVVEKLKTVRRMKTDAPDLIDYDRNENALIAVQPERIKATDIAVRIGTSWIDKEYYKQFFCDLIDLPYYMRYGIELYYNPHDSSWRVDKTTSYTRSYRSMNTFSVYGTSRASAFRLFEDCLNQKFVNIYDTVEEDGREKRVLNQQETIAAREKQNKIKEEFKNWIFEKPERRDELEELYNSLFNQIRLPVYDGSYLKFPGMNPDIELRPHQKNAVARISTGRNTLLHHVVGSGKTYTMVASIETLRRLGLCKKAMIVVPNHLLEQWSSDYLKLYPSAHILTTTKEDVDKQHREKFISKVAMGDFDAIIISQSAFSKINISPERQIAKIKEEIAAIEESIERQSFESGAPQGSVKNLERIKKSREAMLKKLLDGDKKDNVLCFESLGVDYLFVDEADAYKNLFLYTKMNNVAGISNAASQRASDLQLKCEYINELHGGDKGVVFATGTPISNSMTEMYTMMTYLSKETLKNIGITFFDAWAADFGETVTSLELSPSGQGYRTRTRFAKFTNLPELLTLYRAFADVQTSDMVKLDVPEAERITVTVKPSDTTIDLTEQIAERADRIYSGGVDPHEDNMLKVTGDGKKLALDPRCIDSACEDEPVSKLNTCAEKVYEEWRNSTDIRGTQLVFCDLSTPKKAFGDYEYGKDFDAYNDLKGKLVKFGIPEEEIAFIHDANTDGKKQTLFNNVNAGKVRVLIGSTEKCGAGTNVQKRLVAIHHLDAPYRPRDLIQRNGRGIRQGNTNKAIRIYTYATERTFDSYSYQILENKQRFISQIDRGDLTVREAEDIDEATLSYAEIKAITSANPKIKRKMELDTEIMRLRVLESQYKKNLFSLQDKIRKEYPEQIHRQTLYLERVREDTATLKDKYDPEVFSINVLGTVYTDKKEGGRALMDALFGNKSETVVAEYAGFKISLNPLVMMTAERSVTLTGAGQYTLDIGESASGNLTRLENFVKEFPTRIEKAEKRLAQTKEDLKIAEEQVKKPFEHQDKISEISGELAEINAELNLNKHDEIVMDDSTDGESGTEVMRALADTDDEFVEMGETQQKTKKRKRKMTERDLKQLRDTDKNDPEAVVFLAIKRGEFVAADDTAKAVGKAFAFDVETENIGGEEVSVLRIEQDTFDNVVRAITEEGGKVTIIDPIKEEKNEKGRISGTQESKWDELAKTEQGRAYLSARYLFCESAISVLNNDMSYFDAKYTDVLTDKIFTEREDLKKYLEPFGQSETDKMKEYIPPLLDEFAKRFFYFPLEEYGWEMGNVYTAIADNISDESLRNEVKKIDEEQKLHRYIDACVKDIKWLSDRPFSEEDIDDIVNDIKPDFEFSEFNGGFKGDDFDRYYDEFAEEKIIPYLESQAENEDTEESQAKYDYLLEGVNFDEPQKVKTYFAYLKEWFSEHNYNDNQFPVIWDEFFNNEMENDSLAEYFTELAETNPIDNYDLAKEFVDKCNAIGVAEELLFACDIRDMEITLEDGQIVARNEGIEWKGKEFYDFLLHDVVEIDRNGKLLDGYGIDQGIVDDLIKYSKMFEETPKTIDYAKEVMESVEKEFDDFRDSLINEPALNVFHRNYEIHIKTELHDTINGGVDFNKNVYKLLYKEKGHILDVLYNDYVGNVDTVRYGLETYDDTADYIYDYCRRQKEKEKPIKNDSEKTAREILADSVKKEYDEFIRKEKGRTRNQLIYTDNYRIRFYNELVDFLGENIENSGVTDKDVEALLTETPHVIESLYDYFIDSEYVSINTYEDTREFVQYYNDRYHEEMVEDRFKDKTTEYFGKDEKGIAYYHFKVDGLSSGSLSEITEQAEGYVIAANYKAIADDLMKTYNVTFLKVGRDITEEELADDDHAIENMQNAVERRRQAKRQDLKDNIACKKAIEKAISENFDGMHLNSGFENEVIARHGLSRIKYVLSNTLQMKDGDGRFSHDNREWGFITDIEEPQEQRYLFTVESHPAILNGFIDLFRKKEKEFEESMQIYFAKMSEQNADGTTSFQAYILNDDTGEMFPAFEEDFDNKEALDEAFNNFAYRNGFDYYEKKPEELLAMSNAIMKEKSLPQTEKSADKSINGKFLSKTQAGYSVVNITKDDDDRNIAIVYRPKTDDYVVAIRYDTQDGTWGQGLYVSTLEKAENARKEQYGDKPKIYENKEWKKEMDKQSKKEWLKIQVSRSALLGRYEKHSFFKMPETSEYAGWAYNVFNDHIKDSRQLVDLESDGWELSYELSFPEDEIILLKKGEREKELPVKEFKKIADHTSDDDYKRSEEGKKWLRTSVPPEATRGTYEALTLFIMPTDGEYSGYSFYMPNNLVEEDKNSEDGRLVIRMPEDFVVTAKNKEKNSEMKIGAVAFYELLNGTKAEQYKSANTSKSEEPTEDGESEWRYISVPKKAKIAEYEARSLFKMPNGEYEEACYYLPNQLIKENKEKETLRLALPEDLTVTVVDNSGEERKETEFDRAKFLEEVAGKTVKDYEREYKPEPRDNPEFQKREETLRKNVPEEMRKKPNWVVVRTRYNEDKDKVDKFLIDCKTGKFAKSDDPETWSDFDTACEYARENGGVTLAYALDGKDDIACIDLDKCIGEDGEFTNASKQVMKLCGNMYCEKSVSGKGLHILGKTQGLDLRTFSKDGGSEFYQKSQFISMTGDVFEGKTEMKSIDESPVRGYLLEHHDKRPDVVNAGKGVEGLSRMSDRDVVEKAYKSKHGDTFKALYNGEDVQNNHSNSDMKFMNMLAFWCNGDKEQMVRIFQSSGLYRPEKSVNYVEHTVIKAIRDTVGRFTAKSETANTPTLKTNGNGYGKR